MIKYRLLLSDFGNTLVTLIESGSIFGEECNNEILCIVTEVFNKRRDSV